MGRVNLAAALSIVAAVVRPAAADDWSLKLDGGSEYDTNLHRLEGCPDPDAGPLMRTGARYRSTTRAGSGGAARVDVYGGTKLFLTGPGQSESALIASASAGYTRRLPAERGILGVSASYYDTIHYETFDCGAECDDPCGDSGTNRDDVEAPFFSLAGAEATLALPGPGGHQVTASLGYRAFEYKSDGTYDWDGEHYGLAYTAAIWRESDGGDDVSSIDFNAAYRLEHRRYAGSAFTDSCADDDNSAMACTSPTSYRRVDLNHAAAAELVYSGDRIYSARYEAQVNDSNSFGQSLVRQRLELRVTTELFADFLLTATGAVQLNLFVDPLLLKPRVNSQTFITLEDENRNSLAVHLSRELTARWTAEARYAIFSNEFATDELRFRRQTIYAGVVYDFGER